MTKLLKEAFKKAEELPDSLQDELARELLDECEGEKRWDATLAESQDLLERMADKALKDHEEGLTKEMGFDDL